MPGPTEWVDVATTCKREQFVALYRHPFLYSAQKLVKPERPQGTRKLDRTTTKLIRVGGEVRPAAKGGPLVFAVTKVQQSFPSMITVGRTNNNDVPIDDVNLSRFHAFFRLNGALWELADAGSTNGTTLMGKPLEPKGPGRPVKAGDIVGFAQVDFVFMTPEAAWERLREAGDDWDY